MGKRNNSRTKQGVILTIVLVLLGVGAAYALQKQDKNEEPAKSSSSNELKTFVDSANIYSFRYPSNWEAVDIPTASDGGTAPDPQVQSQAIWLRYPGAPLLTTDEKAGPYRINGISISAGKTEARNAGYSDAFKNAEKSKVNGYDLQIAKSTEEYGYRQHLYLVSDGTNDVVFMFRDKQTLKAGKGATAFDESDKLPEIRKVVNTMHFIPQE